MTTQEIMQALSPFYAATVQFKAPKADDAHAYDCPRCHKDIGPVGTDAALSYATSRYGTWAHANCVLKAGLPVSDSATDKKKAREAARARHDAQKAADKQKPTTPRTATTTPPAATTPVYADDVALRAQIRAELDAEYDQRMQQAIAVIQKLQAERDMLRQALLDSGLTDQGRQDAVAA